MPSNAAPESKTRVWNDSLRQMPMLSFTRARLSESEKEEMVKVLGLANSLQCFLSNATDSIAAAHQPGADSSHVQRILARHLCGELNFVQEKILQDDSSFSTRARPDFIHHLGPNRGVLAEVERGGVRANNHDLKDMWKAHLAPNAHHLFLVVPLVLHNREGLIRERPFSPVANRLSTFFGDSRRELDVVSLHVFGYGDHESLQEAQGVLIPA